MATLEYDMSLCVGKQRRAVEEASPSALTMIAVIVAALLAAGVALVGSGSANAASTQYFACPVPVAGAGCGISGSVGLGKYLAEFKYAGPQGYDFEPFVDQCSTSSCPVFHWAVGRDDRTPAGFQITSDSPFALGRMLP